MGACGQRLVVARAGGSAAPRLREDHLLHAARADARGGGEEVRRARRAEACGRLASNTHGARVVVVAGGLVR